MAKGEYHKVLEVGFDQLFDVITDYENYPEFLSDVTHTEVTRTSDTTARVRYELNLIKKFEYVLDLKEDREAGVVEWSLVEGDMFKVNSGGWKLKRLSDDETEIDYHVEVEFNIRVPGLILNKIVKGSLPKMVDSFEKRAQEVG